MSRSLNGTTVMLTGAGGALATAIAQELVDVGAELILVGRGESLERAEDRFPAKAALDLDLTDPSSVEVLARQKPDILVHTVGGYRGGDSVKATDAQRRELFALNFDSLFYAVQGVLPHMLKQKDGVILGVASLSAARMSGPRSALYTASKAALSAYLGSLNAEYRDRGVYAATLYPMGSIDTAANRASLKNADDDTLIDPRELAQAVSFLLRRTPYGHLTELKVYPAKG